MIGLLRSFILCVIIYGGVAIMGFLMFGQATQSQINLNMPPDSITSKVALWTTALSGKSQRFMIYVHSKGMIVDVEDVIIGSANVNQRSMEGSGDT